MYKTTGAAHTASIQSEAVRNLAETSNAKRSLSIDCRGGGAVTATTNPVIADFKTSLSALRLHVLWNLTVFRWKIAAQTSIAK